MKILLDAYVLLPPERGAGGAGVYLHALLAEWNRNRVNVRVITSVHNHYLFDSYVNLDIVVIHENATWAYYPHFEWADVFFAPLNGLWPRIIPPRLPVVACIHDLQHLVAPSFFEKKMWDARNHDYGFAIDRADRLVAISEYEKYNFERFFGKMEVDVVYHGAYLSERYNEAELPSIVEVQLADKDYVIYPAVPWPHKNHLSLLYAWDIYTKKLGGTEILLLTGASEHGHAKANLAAVIDHLGLSNSVMLAGHQPDPKQARLIKNAKALVFPSMYEGFGIPIIEAMRLGTPVLASSIPALKEVGQGVVAYLRDAQNPISSAQDMADLLSDRSRLKQLSEMALPYSEQFTSAQMARNTLNTLYRAIEIKNGSVASGRVEKVRNIPSYERGGTLMAFLVLDGQLEDAVLTERLLDEKLRVLKSYTTRVFVYFPTAASLEVLEMINQRCEAWGAPCRGYGDNALNPYAWSVKDGLSMEGKSTYLMLSTLNARYPVRDCVQTAIAELEFYRDLGAAFFVDDIPFSQITRPAKEVEAYASYMRYRDSAAMPFTGAIVRREIADQVGILGGEEFLAYFLKNISYLETPFVAIE